MNKKIIREFTYHDIHVCMQEDSIDGSVSIIRSYKEKENVTDYDDEYHATPFFNEICLVIKDTCDALCDVSEKPNT